MWVPSKVVGPLQTTAGGGRGVGEGGGVAVGGAVGVGGAAGVGLAAEFPEETAAAAGDPPVLASKVPDISGGSSQAAPPPAISSAGRIRRAPGKPRLRGGAGAATGAPRIDPSASRRAPPS